MRRPFVFGTKQFSILLSFRKMPQHITSSQLVIYYSRGIIISSQSSSLRSIVTTNWQDNYNAYTFLQLFPLNGVRIMQFRAICNGQPNKWLFYFSFCNWRSAIFYIFFTPKEQNIITRPSCYFVSIPSFPIFIILCTSSF